MLKELEIPPDRRILGELRAGDEVLLSGTAITLRDGASKRLEEVLAAGEKPPFELEGQLVFHAGPTPPKADRACAAIGPTTTARMDRFLEVMIEAGVAAVLGKGPRGEAALELHRLHGLVYFAAVGGVAALMGGMIERLDKLAWGDLGPGAVYRVEMKGLPAVVAIDGQGDDFFTRRRSVYRRAEP